MKSTKTYVLSTTQPAQQYALKFTDNVATTLLLNRSPLRQYLQRVVILLLIDCSRTTCVIAGKLSDALQDRILEVQYHGNYLLIIFLCSSGTTTNTGACFCILIKVCYVTIFQRVNE